MTTGPERESHPAYRVPDDIDVRPLASRADYDACVALQELTWGVGFNERVPSGILKLSQRLGGVASGAFDSGGELLGFVFGMSGLMAGRLAHWSDMLAVHPNARDRGIGEALKWHQRSQLLQAGVHVAYWTFDPLEARNAWLNFTRLGAVAREYVRNFYDASDSPLHKGLATDRLIVTWLLDSERVRCKAAETGARHDPDLETAPIVNPVAVEGRAPDIVSLRRDVDEPIVRIAIPSNLQQLKREALEEAAAWQAVVREAFEGYFASGFEVTDLLRSAGQRSYVLRRRD